MTTRVAYIMSRFPHLPETFILREMIEVEKQGISVALYPLMVQEQKVVHPAAQEWMPRANRLPWISPAILGANLRQLQKHPTQYAKLVARVFSGNLLSPKFLIRALAMLPKVVRMAELMKQENIQHIHAHYATHPALAAWIIHQLTGIPYSITVHAHDIYVNRTMLAPKMKDAAFVVAISEFNRQFLARHLGEWILDKTHVIHCGIEPERYPVQEKLPAEPFEMVSIGSLQPYKGQADLVEACTRLHQRGFNFRCRIIGGGELASALEKQINAQGLKGKVILTGPQTQDAVAQMLGEADCYIQPSIITPSGKMEGIPVALMEAMACGLPVIATNISGIPELVRPNQTGWLTPEKDPEQLANAIFAVASNPQASRVLARAGRDWVLKEFALQDNVRKFTELLNNSVRSIM
jgi:colanic acid/amylovoran biosynthesis glycosyltransferase